jgi:hypothetical protein
MIQIIDDYLPNHEFLQIKDEMLGEYFPWYLNLYQVHKHVDKTPQHVHIFYDNCLPNSNKLDLIYPLLTKLNFATLRRVKANLVMSQPEIVTGVEHVDYDRLKGKTSVYYLNSNNGGTLINGELVQSVANRMVIFDSNTLHSAVNCSDEPYRCVINFNYTEWDNE